MNEREMLELAAKAADQERSFAGELWSNARGLPWNPLEDDGDALRLAVKLNLWEAVRLAHRQLGAPGCPDLYAATRRAIVLAAAEIGRSKE